MKDKLEPLRFIVLVDDMLLKKWQVESIRSLVNSPYANCVSFVVNEGVAPYKNAKQSLGFRFIDRLVRNNSPLETIDVSIEFSSIPKINCTPIVKGYSNFFPEERLEQIKTLKADFILRFGFGILKGEILKASRYGVWSFHHGDPLHFRGGPAAFWEIYHKKPLTGAILQRITEKLDSGIVLKSGRFKTSLHSYKESLHRVLESTQQWPLLAVKDILFNQTLPSESIESNAPIYKLPSNLQAFTFLCRLFAYRVQFNYRQLFQAEFWQIGLINQPIETLISEKVTVDRWFKSTAKHRYWADCFAYSENDFLVEEYDYTTGKGSIVKLDLKGNAQNVLEKETHLSYPFTIKQGDNRFLLPENYKNEKLFLYQEVEKQWVPKLLLEGAWVDPSLFFHDSKWWLFCTNAEAPNEELHLFYADSIDGNYQPHLLNPIIQNIENARPAGNLFMHEGKLYRPAQSCATTYGECVRINEIKQLSATSYREEYVKSIYPNELDKKFKGLHTISSFGNRTLLDVKITAFNFPHFAHQLKSKLRRKR